MAKPLDEKESMKGLVIEHGSLLLVDDLAAPIPKDNEVLIRVMSTTLSAGDSDIWRGELDNYLPDAQGEFRVQTGLDFSGIVEKSANGFRSGQKVYGFVDVFEGQKGHQEYVSVDKECIALMPATLTFDEAASVPASASIALAALRDVAQIKPDERVLINGAAGGLGIFAVQIAKAVYQCEVTAVAGSGQSEFLKALGADTVIDYRKNSIANLKGEFDVVLDFAKNLSFADVRHVLSDSARFVPSDPIKNKSDFIPGTQSAKRTKYLLISKGKKRDLDSIAIWMEKGLLTTHVDRVFDFDNYEDAVARLNERNKRGRIVLSLATL